MYLIDTNIWLERLLDQKKSEEVGQFLLMLPPDKLLITDFAFHSIGVVCIRLERKAAFLSFVEDIFLNGSVNLVSILPEEMHRLLHAIDKFNLDFDDAYQYAAAEKYKAIIVSYDSDFDRTELGKKTPGEISQQQK